MGKMKYRKGVFCVIYEINNSGNVKYLIFKRKLHWKGWEFAKGGIKKEEKILDAVKREIKEETGLKPVKIKKFDVSGKYKYEKELKEREGVAGQTYFLYAVEVNKRKIKLDKLEHSSYEWVSFKRAMRKLTWPNQRKCLKVVDNYLLK
jgi:8-oxo-dGTP pyrophosphatase MutT (NUDIX family)